MEPSGTSLPAGAAAGCVPGTERGAGSQSVGFALSQLGWATASHFRDALEPLGLEPRQFAILRAMAGFEGQSQQAVCSALCIPPSRMVGLLDALEERGLVERLPNATDRRARAIHVTPAGRELLGEATRRAMDHERWVCEPLSADEREQLLVLLGRLADHYDLSGGVHPDLTTVRAQPWPGNPPRPHRPAPEG